MRVQQLYFATQARLGNNKFDVWWTRDPFEKKILANPNDVGLRVT